MNLPSARVLAHMACQWPSRAARANLAALPDDSHSNLGWHAEHAALVSHPLETSSGNIALGFSFARSSLMVLGNGELAEELLLGDANETTATAWCDEQLAALGGKTTAGVVTPYELEETLPWEDFSAHRDAVARLGIQYAAADQALNAAVAGLADRFSPGPSPVRCWPHHFDLATLISLESGDPETARSVGLGFSPGDGSYASPYCYCSPWPAPDTASLPQPANGFTWHTQGFVSMVLVNPDTADLADQLAEALAITLSMLNTE